FSAFMHLADYNEQLVGERIWTESRHIEARLADLTEHMENVIQKYLRNQFPTIEDYNVHAGEVAEPYRFVVLADVPMGLSENAAKRLASVIAAGPRCGVYTLIAQDLRHPLPMGLMQTDLDAATVRMAWKRGDGGVGRFVRSDSDFAPWPLEVERPPVESALNAVVHAAGRAAKDAGRVEVPFEMIAPGPDRVWSASTAKELRIPIGRAGATKLQELVLGRGTAQHALIAGRTGSGKSTLLHALIVSGALWHSPAELEMYLVDFKKGVEFKTYATHHLPHARVVAVESEREFGLSVLRRLDAVLRARGDDFRACGAQDVAAYRAARPGERMPRVLLVIDEFQELFVEDDKIAQESALLLDRLVRQGRAFGMHVVLGSQTLGGAYSLARSTIGQMGVRIALACNEADALLIMGDDNTAPRLLHRPGEAIYNDASGAVEANNPFQVAWLSDARRTELLDLARDKAPLDAGGERGRGTEHELVVFEGSAPADLANNRPLARAAAAAAGGAPATISPLVWLGEPVAIKDPTAFALRKQSGANLLIVGQQDQTALAMGVSALASLAAQGVRGADVCVLDGTPADAPSDMQGVLERESGLRLPGVRMVAYRDVGEVLTELAAEVEKRVQGEGGPTKVLLIHGLQRYRVLRRPEDEFDFSSGGDDKAARPDRLLATILREGPGVGVHVVCWCDTLASLNRALDRGSVREFDGRVLMQISAADSSALIDSPVAGALGGNRAILFSEELGQIEKFRPYALPAAGAGGA
ncbi:MAG: FtsK/SpoIIIE domain-containing protein, partial [Phycisphaerales bacterium]